MNHGRWKSLGGIQLIVLLPLLSNLMPALVRGCPTEPTASVSFASGTLCDAKPKLTWAYVSGATQYSVEARYQYPENGAWHNIPGTPTSTELLVTRNADYMQPGLISEFRVGAAAPQCTTMWSEPIPVTTVAIEPPPTGVRIDPTTECAPTLKLEWNARPGVEYVIQARREDVYPETWIAVPGSPTLAPPFFITRDQRFMVPGQHTQIRVGAQILPNCSVRWSTPISFYVRSPNPPPVSALASMQGGRAVHITWDPGQNPGSLDNTWMSIYRDDELEPIAEVSYADLEYDYVESSCAVSRYRLLAFSATGCPAGSIYTNSVLLPPIPPVLEYPASGGILCESTDQFRWSIRCGATKYEVQIASNINFTTESLIADRTGELALDANTYSPLALPPLTTLHWRVRALRAPTASSWTVGTFSTGRTPYYPGVTAPYAVRAIQGSDGVTYTSGPVYAGETATLRLYPAPLGCSSNWSWALLNGAAANYATSANGNQVYVANLGVSSSLTLMWRGTPSNTFGQGETRDWGFVLAPGSRPGSSGGGGGGGACPYVAVWNGLEFVDDNNLLPQTEWSGRIGQVVSDRYVLRETPIEDQGLLRLRIHEFEREISWFDQVQLHAVAHPEGTRIALVEDGSVVAFEWPNEPNTQTGPRRIHRGDRLPLRGLPDIHDDASGGGGERGVLVVGSAVMKPEAVAGVGTQPIGPTLTLRERQTWSFLPMTIRPEALDVYAGAEVTEASIVRVVARDLRPRAVALQSGHGPDGEPVVASLSSHDGETVSIAPGQSIDLSFAAVPRQEGMTYSWILETVGRYERMPQESPTPSAVRAGNLLRQVSGPGGDAGIILEYRLSEPVNRLSLTVFDVAGRQVATHVLGPQRPGSGEFSLDTSGMSGGIYFGRMVDVRGSEQRILATERLVLLR